MTDFWWRIQDRFRRIFVYPFYSFGYGIQNFWRFRKEIWNFRGWEYGHNVDLFKRTIECSLKDQEWAARENAKEFEVDYEESSQFANMRRFIYLADRHEFPLKDAEEALGLKVSDLEDMKLTDDDRRIFTKVEELSEAYWSEMWDIVKKDARTWWN